MKQMLTKCIGAIVNLIGVFSSKIAAKIALHLFSSPRRIRLKELERDFLMTAFTEEVQIGDNQIMTYRWLGKKDTILLAHGWESNSYRWKPLIEQLKALDYGVVCLDAPAHGRSSGKTFNAVLYSECIHVIAKKFKVNVVVGHSVGGMAAAFFQHNHPLPSVKKLVFLGAPSNFVGVFSRYVAMMGYTKSVANGMDKLIFERFNEEPEYFNAARFSEHVEPIGLVIHDKRDKIIPYSDAKDYEIHYKNARLITTEGFGHGLKTEEIHNHIIDFIDA
ncbi:alpha/beta hydrolase [Psychroserpens sp.]|uniref:alpha/beta hydrolase n=1 Tax=Psychroserpens sp. TaxID=2020870 RepID=UPI003C77100A